MQLKSVPRRNIDRIRQDEPDRYRAYEPFLIPQWGTDDFLINTEDSGWKEAAKKYPTRKPIAVTGEAELMERIGPQLWARAHVRAVEIHALPEAIALADEIERELPCGECKDHMRG